MIWQLIFLIGAYGWRLRGSAGDGGWVQHIFGRPVGTQLGRILFWALPAGTVVALWGAPSLQVWLLAVPALWLGTVPGYFGGQFSVANPLHRNVENYALLTARGLVIALPLVVVLGGAGWGGILAGALFAPCYLLGCYLQPRAKLPAVGHYSEWGEWLLGGAVLCGIVATL